MVNAKKFWDGIAEKYAKNPIADIKSYNYTLERTRSYLSQDDKILEVGCGTGSTALLLSENVAHITASDLSANMIKIARQKASEQGIKNVSFIEADLQSDALDRKATNEAPPYDAILALNLLHLLTDAPAAIKTINTLLKPDGIFISKTVCQFGKGTSLKFRLIKLLLPLMQLIGKAPFVKFRTIKEHEEMITKAGFKIIETGNYPASPPNRYVVARKL